MQFQGPHGGLVSSSAADYSAIKGLPSGMAQAAVPIISKPFVSYLAGFADETPY